jgi:hypothetical protein
MSDFSSVVDYGELEDTWDALYYFMKFKLKGMVQEALLEADKHGGCKAVKLRQLMELKREKVKPVRRPEESFYLIEADDLDGPTGEIINVKLRSGDAFAENAYPVCKPGDLLYLRIRPYLRKVAIVPEEFEVEGGETVNFNRHNICCSGEFYVLTVKPNSSLDLKLLAKYLWAYLRSDLALLQVLPRIIGATRPRIGSNDLLNIIVPLPREEAIREIITLIEHLTERINQARRVVGDVVVEFKKTYGPEIMKRLAGSNKVMGISEALGELLIESGYLPKSFFYGFY